MLATGVQFSVVNSVIYLTGCKVLQALINKLDFGQTFINSIYLSVTEMFALIKSWSVSSCEQKHASESWVIRLRANYPHLTDVQ